MISTDLTGRHISAFQDSPYRLQDQVTRKFNIPSNLGFSNLGNGRLDFLDTYNTKCPKFIESDNKYDTSVLEKNYADTKYRFVECMNNANKYFLPLHNPGLYKKRQASFLKFTLKSQAYVTPNVTHLPNRQTIVRKYLELDNLPSFSARKSKMKMPDFQLRPMYIGRSHVESHWLNEKTRDQDSHEKEISPLANHFKSYLPKDLNDKCLRLELPNLKINETSEFERYSTMKEDEMVSYQRNKSKIFSFKKDKHDLINVSELLDQLRMKKLHKTEAKRLKQSVDEEDKPKTVTTYQFQTNETIIDDDTVPKNKEKSKEKALTHVNHQTTEKEYIEEIAEPSSKKLRENSREDFEDIIEIKTSKKDTKTGRDKTKRKKSRKNYMMDRYLNSVEPPKSQSRDQMLNDQNNKDANETNLYNIEEINKLDEFPSTTNNVKASLHVSNTLEIVNESEAVWNESLWNHATNKMKPEDSFQSNKPGEALKLNENSESVKKKCDDNEKIRYEKNYDKKGPKLATGPSEKVFDDNIKSPTEKVMISEDEFYDCTTAFEDQVSRCSSCNIPRTLDTNCTDNVPPNTDFTEHVLKTPNTNHAKEEKRETSESVYKRQSKSNHVNESSTQYDLGTNLIETRGDDQDRLQDIVAKKSMDSKNKDTEEHANKVYQDMNTKKKTINMGCETDMPNIQEKNNERRTLCTQTQTTVYNVCETRNETKIFKDMNHKSISITSNLANSSCDPVIHVGFEKKDDPCNKYAKSIGIQTESNSDINDEVKIAKIQKIVEKALKREIGARTNVTVSSKERCLRSPSNGIMPSSTDESCYKIILVKKGKPEDKSDSKGRTINIESYENSKSKTKIESHTNCWKLKHALNYNSVEGCRSPSPLRYQYHPKLMSEKKRERSETKRRNSQQCSRNGSICKSCRKVNFKESKTRDPSHPRVTKKENKSHPIRRNPEIKPQSHHNHVRIKLDKPEMKAQSNQKHARFELRCRSSGNLSNKTNSILMSEIEASLASTIDSTESYDTQVRNKTHVVDEKTSSNTITFSDCTKTESLIDDLGSSNENQRSSVKVRKISAKNVKWTRKENQNEMDEIDITLSLSCCSSCHGQISQEGIDKRIRSSLKSRQLDYIQRDSAEGKSKMWIKSDGIPLTSGGGKSRMWEKCDTDYLQLRDSKKWYHFCFKP